MFVRRLIPSFDGGNGSYEQLLRMRLQVEQVVCAKAAQDLRERFGVGFVEEEFEPETLRFFYIIIFFFLSIYSVTAA
jgi:hypothetical protein